MKGLIKDSEFLTKRSSERLRITLTSTIQLVEYLLNDCAFSYVLTAKCNQDSLELIKLFLLGTYITINIYFIFVFCFYTNI